MKIIVASGGRFHSVHLAKQLLKKKLLTRFYSWACTANESVLFDTLIKEKKLASFMLKLYEKCRLSKIISPAQWTIFYDAFFDRWLAHELQNEVSFDLLVGWAHYVLQSIPVARQKGAKIAIEAGSMHILDIQQIINAELELHGFLPQAIDQRNINKILQEYKEADAIMVPSSHVATSFKNYGISSNKIQVAPYGTELSFFTPKQKKPDHFSALFVGRIGLAKGIHYLLEAWDLVNLPAQKATLHMVGPIDEQTKEYLSRRKKNDSIIWHGGKPHHALNSFYQTASVFVMPSLQEGLAMVLVEAMAASLPLIATTRTGAEDLITEGKEGFLIPPNNIELLAKKIEWSFLHQEELFEMGKSAAQKATLFTWDQYGNKVIEIYQAICRPPFILSQHSEAVL